MIRKYDGDDLAKVLAYFDFIGEISQAEFSICCPFHNDPKPSMRINLSTGSWYCFGCGLFGNAYDFIKNAFPELDDLQAAIVLEKVLNRKEVKKIKVYRQRNNRTNYNAFLDEAKDYYYGIKQTDWYNLKCKEEEEAFAYLDKRRISKRALTVSRCKVNKYNAGYPILFPILDNGVFCGWVARTTSKNVEDRRKYLYNEGFKKRITLCGVYKEKCVPYICEGFFDYLSLRFRGRARNTVAILGWHISDEQVKKLKQFGVEKVVCALDNPEVDKAGERGIKNLEKFFDVIRFPYPIGVKDPGDMTEQQLLEAVEETERRIKYEIGR